MHSSPEMAIGELGAVIVNDYPAHGSPGFITSRIVTRGSTGVCCVLREQFFAARKSLLQVLVRPPTLARRRRSTRDAGDIGLSSTA